LDITLTSDIEPSYYNINLSNKYGKTNFSFPIFERDTAKNVHQGFSNEDVIYLIFADRFSNGDTSNDYLSNDKEEFDFGSLNGRHGGDIQGIINKLDYVKDLGLTTIWITPMLENNMYMSYHGYAATDLYKIDPRFGTNELYRELIKSAHQNGIKVIMDHVSNHIGVNHVWIKNRPTRTWFNGTINNHESAYHNKMAFMDIHGESASIRKGQTGWFEDYMPDLNQKDLKLAKYLIQNTLWWIESTGIDGIREDTYPYNDQKFMSDWARTILDIYPDFNIVGEVWKGEPTILAKYQTNTYFPREYDSNLPIVTDFAFRDVLFGYLSGRNNLYNIYELFAKDFVYADPNDLLVFFDNHDIDRGMFAAKWNIQKFKAAITLLLTTRGIPQLTYGTEIGLDGGGHHGKIRSTFPQGFVTNGIPNISEERLKDQVEIFEFTKKLLHLRKEYKALSIGNFLHYPPEDNLYIYKKVLGDQEILILINDSDEKKKLDIYKLFDYIQMNKIQILLGEQTSYINEENIYIDNKSIAIYKIQ